MDTPELSTQDYHIGWICALHEESTAAIAMLDEEYDPLLEQDSDNHNGNVLGHIHRHNVVIACMSEASLDTREGHKEAAWMLLRHGQCLKHRKSWFPLSAACQAGYGDIA